MATVKKPTGNKRFRQATALVEDRTYGLQEAAALVSKVALAKFDETVDVAMCLNLSDKGVQPPRGMVQLPAGTGRSVRVAVFARGPKADEAKAAGADVVGAEDLMETVEKGQIDFDQCIATPDMMGIVGRLGRVLGPKGLMPNPKLGTVTMDVTSAVKAAKGGQVAYRPDKAGVVHAGLGKASFKAADLEKNLKAFFEAVLKDRPQAVKGTYIKRAHLSTTMGPSIALSMPDIWTLA